eukprot:scaffold251621_cov37-Prasinocladus_malaysianus.AAC.1
MWPTGSTANNKVNVQTGSVDTYNEACRLPGKDGNVKHSGRRLHLANYSEIDKVVGKLYIGIAPFKVTYIHTQFSA